MLDLRLIFVVLPVVGGAVAAVALFAALRTAPLSAPLAALFSSVLAAAERLDMLVGRGSARAAAAGVRVAAPAVDAADRRVVEGTGRGLGFLGRCGSLLARAASTGRVRTTVLFALAGVAALALALEWALFAAR